MAAVIVEMFLVRYQMETLFAIYEATGTYLNQSAALFNDALSPNLFI
jgi:hypothetical protein